MRIRRLLVATVVLAAVQVGVPATASAQTLVPCSGPALQTAVATVNTAGGGTLNLTSGCTYTLTAPASGDNGLAVITTPVRINGNFATITRSSATAFRFFDVDGSGNLTLDNLTLTNGRAREGGAIRASDSARLTVSGSTLTGNTATLEDGGGILVTSSTAAVGVSNSTLSNNNAGNNGGGILSFGTATINGSAVLGNRALVGGGVSNERGVVTLNGTRIEGNAATNEFESGFAFGGGLLNSAGTMTLTGSVVLNNTTSAVDGAQGGGVWSAGFPTTLNITGSTIMGNTASGLNSSGGGIYSADGNATLLSSAVVSNRVVGGDLAGGGGIYRLDGTVTLAGSAVVSNQPDNCGNPSTVPDCS
jgi:Periplasmic copper-binding protein (NosD)